MEYGLCRAMISCQLDLDQLFRLHEKEKVRGFAYFPFEVNELFGTPALRIFYEIPDDEGMQGAHIQRIRSEFYREKIWPRFRNLCVTDLEEINVFDEEIRKIVVEDMKIEMKYVGRGGKGRIRNLVESLE